MVTPKKICNGELSGSIPSAKLENPCATFWWACQISRALRRSAAAVLRHPNRSATHLSTTAPRDGAEGQAVAQGSTLRTQPGLVREREGEGEGEGMGEGKCFIARERGSPRDGKSAPTYRKTTPSYQRIDQPTDNQSANQSSQPNQAIHPNQPRLSNQGNAMQCKAINQTKRPTDQPNKVVKQSSKHPTDRPLNHSNQPTNPPTDQPTN